jgi:hypothetical protein
MPYEIRSNVTRNALFVRLEGFLTDTEAVEVADKVIAELERLRPGFDAITDITHFKPGSAKVASELMRTQQAYKAHGIRRVIRIVGESVVAKMQFQRTGEEVGLEMAYVSSFEEAEKLLAK